MSQSTTVTSRPSPASAQARFVTTVETPSLLPHDVTAIEMLRSRPSPASARIVNFASRLRKASMTSGEPVPLSPGPPDPDFGPRPRGISPSTSCP